MIIPPPSVIASWPKPDYANPESQGPAGVGIGSTFVALVTIILLLRLYTRRWISKGFGLDDILIVGAYVTLWVRLLTLASLATLILFDAATSLTKLSMLAMLYKLTTASADKKMNHVILGLSALISLNAFIFVIVELFQCRPISDYWTPSAGRQNCIDEATHLEAAGIINTISDFILVFLPIRTVLGLKLPWKQRLIVLALFSAGFLASIAGIVRVYFTSITANDPNFDRTWNSWANWIASTVELGLGITAWVIKDEPEPQGSTSRWSYDKSSPLPARLLPAFIKQHTRGASLQEVKVETEDELHLRTKFNSSNNKQQHKRSTSLQDTPSSSTVQPVSTFVHNRGTSLQSPLSSPFSSTTPIRPRPAVIGHKRGASLQDNNARRPSLGGEPKTPVDVNKPLPSVRRSRPLSDRHLGHSTTSTGIVGYDPTEEAVMPAPLTLRRTDYDGPYTKMAANAPQNSAMPDTPSQQRDGVRYSGEETRLSSGPRDDRTTVLIMFKGDKEPQQPPHVPLI
ncbi:uncharacterized protein PG986_013401 [Apiospora aurea]|uniref:Rhodopsin domain-containing protein n=1 Tax=Apiospora aurea TaxID=335848 RepID=A0ABR1PVS8_9PEZI